ncbi:MAG: FprA family A-type flavoprotein [Clostridium sp.]|uniref:FprA family A-type flavoprotein n=1 Tax=Clostridium sp. TaxID=1506 RepID=UPI002A8CBE39|nr:FprA family A-type flavoprotein [Clostridium sp.]MDY5099172.1 FprA family A-type flavoprotein [Clostridium sp.]
MKSVEIKKDIFWVGALDPGLRVFDIIMYTPYGTSYNSYIVKGSEKIAVFETVKEEFFDQYIERLNSLDINVSDIDYIIVDHTEPDHAGSVSKILDLAPKAKVIGSNCAIQYLTQIVNKPFESIVAKDGTSISLGNKTLNFISAPFLHWPDSMYTYIPEDSLLITCDSFGSHYSEENVFNDFVKSEEDYMTALKYYYDCIFGPFKPYVLKAIDKIKDLSIDTICPGHGPILRENPWKIVNIYKEWSTPAPSPKTPNITISYVSAYGYTKQLAEEIAKGIASKGDFEIKLFDLVSSSQEEILKSINKSDGILFGSPTINCDLLEPIRDLMTKLNPIVHGKKVAGAFGSYGWSGEAVPNMETRLKELRMDLLLPSLKIKFKPSSEELDSAFNFGELFADKVLTKRNK